MPLVATSDLVPRAMEQPQVWQYKFVKNVCHDPVETANLFATTAGWGKLGPAASERCENAMSSPTVGLNYYMTLAPMISFKFHLVGHRSEGLTLARFSTDLEDDTRCIAKRLNTKPIQISVEVVPDGGQKCFLRFYSIGGEEKLVIRNKTFAARWGPTLRAASHRMGRTNQDYHYIKFISMDGVEITEDYHDDVLGSKLRLSVPRSTKKTRGKFNK